MWLYCLIVQSVSLFCYKQLSLHTVTTEFYLWFDFFPLPLTFPTTFPHCLQQKCCDKITMKLVISWWEITYKEHSKLVQAHFYPTCLYQLTPTPPMKIVKQNKLIMKISIISSNSVLSPWDMKHTIT